MDGEKRKRKREKNDREIREILVKKKGKRKGKAKKETDFRNEKRNFKKVKKKETKTERTNINEIFRVSLSFDFLFLLNWIFLLYSMCVFSCCRKREE